MSSYLIEYMKAHAISIQQDIEEISNKMETLDENSKDFRDLDFEFNWLNGNINATLHLLGVAQQEGRND
jgi:hypothetical protein